MKFISNILLAIALVIYIFFPLFDLGIFGTKTGYDFTETMINSPANISMAIFSLLPFIGCFGAIIFNCLKSKYWSILSILFIVAALFFFYSTYICGIKSCTIFNITDFAWGFNSSIVVIILAGVSTIISILPIDRFKCKS